jgi:hypothetical protein
MSPSVPRRRQPGRTPPPSQGRSSRMPAVWSALIVTAVWAAATGAYFAFRDDVTQPMTEMQNRYEKRIADLRAQFDLVTNRQFLDQERIQQQLNALLQWQASLEQHASPSAEDQLATGSISANTPDRGSIASGPPAAELSRAMPVSTPKSVSARHGHRPRAQRRPAARLQQHGGDQAAPAAAQLDLGQRSFAPD